MSGGGGVQSVQGPGGFSPSTLLTLIKTVDGTSSGLDADLVRGTTPTTAGLSVLALTSIAAGGLILGSGANAVGTLAIGTSGYVLRSNGTTAAWAALDAGDISAGTLTAARGGTGVSNAGTLTNASNTTITGGGTLALGGFTLTVPATGTTALLATANAFTAAQTIQAANGLTVTAASTQDAIRIAGRAGGTGSYIGTITPATLSASRTYTLPDADLTITGGGTLALGGFTLTVPATGTAGLLGVANNWTLANTFSLASGTAIIVSSSTNSTSKDTGSIVTEGGIGAEKDIVSGTGIYAAQVIQAGSGAASSSVNLIADGGASGTNAGATTYIRNGGATIIGFGNYSAMLGGAYDARPFMYTLVPFNFLDGIRSISPTGGIGYATGAGGTVTQGSGSGKATTVVLNTVCGTITMDGANLNADTTVAFTFTNSAIAATDLVVIQHSSAGTLGAYNFAVTPGSGTATVSVRNVTPGNLAEAIVLRFVVIKAVTA